MHPFPHRYVVEARAAGDGVVQLDSPGLSLLETAPPLEFDGPGDRWSPETLLVGAVADCFVLSLRAIARASKFEWTGVECAAAGELDRVEGMLRFTAMTLQVQLRIPAGADPERARRILDKAERSCLIMNSLVCKPVMTAEVLVG